MRWALLIALVMLLPCIAIGNDSTQAASEYKTRIINSFETGVEESTDYGSWVKSTQVVGVGGSADVTQSSAQQYHGTYSAKMHVLSGTGPTAWASATMTFTSNSSLGHSLFDTVVIARKLVVTSPPVYAISYFTQWNGATLLDLRTDVLSGTGWILQVMSPIWYSNATFFKWEISVFTDDGPALEGDLYLDMLYCTSGSADVRVRYWNLYTGLGYYAEKLLARYYTFPDGWVDIWQNEFQVYKGDDVLLQVTDIFGRNVWTGMFYVNRSIVYVDILVPIVTVHIAKPDWYDDSVPMEWQITCLPWGPDGLPGMELPALGFEFEVLAGWYNIAWFSNHYVDGGNQTIYISGNSTERRSYMLSNFTIPINPEYELEVNGGGAIIDLKSWSGFFNSVWVLAAALYDDSRVKAIGLFLMFLAVVGLMYRAKQLKVIAQKQRRGT